MRLALAAIVLLSGQAEGRPQWIWGSKDAADGEVVHFRKTFTTPSRPASATLIASCDNACEVFLNGKAVGSSSEWREPVRSDAGGAIVRGENVIAVRGANEGGAAGLVVRLEMKFADGAKQEVVSDATWLASGSAPKGWETPAFDAKGWKPAAALGALGVGPWGDVFSGAPAAGAQASPSPTALDGFKVEVLYTVPREEGSWVAMTFDPKGRILVSPQQGKLLRLTLGEKVQVERLDVAVGDAQGLRCAFGSLYVTGNGPQGTAMYRLREKGDGFEPAECLKKWPGGMGEHGPHGIVLGPDKKLYCVVGNHVKPPAGLSPDSPHRNWREDLLLPRMWDPNGHAVGILAPGGYVVRTDADGKDWEMFCGGFRNQYDAAFSPEGELFTYDSDMEWDIGTPWYRPTRIYHLVQGGEYGWRSATGKWPAWYPDNLPMTADIGLGSPTGMEFGTGAKFPAKYQRALYACDWAYGKIYAVHLKPDGASYRSTFEPFVTGKPLNVADLEVGPDGALYFVTGGRGTQSRLYRVTYTGSESTAPAPAEPSEARALRRKLEAWQSKREPQAVREIWPQLSSADRWIRFAARIALENQPLEAWRDRAFYETLPPASLAATLAMARVGPKALQPRLLETLGRLGAPWDKAGEDEKLDLLRAYQVVFTRMGPPDAASREHVLKKLDPLYPAAWEPLNRELCQLLVFLDAPKVIDRTLDLLAKAESQQEQLHYAFHLRNVKAGWTPPQRRAYVEWLSRARDLKGGHSFQGFIRNIRNEGTAQLSEAEKKDLEPLLARIYLPVRPQGQPEKLVQAWAVADFEKDLDQAATGRNFNRGRDAFLRAQCLACHRFGSEGGSIGSDLTAVSSRFTRRDILESILLPSKVLSDQYQNTMFQIEGGDVVVGRVVGEEGGKLLVRTNPLEEQVTPVPKDKLKASKPSPVSPMPEGLVNILRKDEILDLLAYIESGGKQNDPRFLKK